MRMTSSQQEDFLVHLPGDLSKLLSRELKLFLLVKDGQKFLWEWKKDLQKLS